MQGENFVLFLAGSIEMGAATQWQTEITKRLSHLEHLVILNPRRDDWDSTWVQSIDNPQFNEQVTWELDAMDDANLIYFHFDPATKSPITLLELGLHTQGTPVLVNCGEGYWRKGNVDIVCARYRVPTVITLDEAVVQIEAEYEAFMAQ
jgi:hypothetical protein